MLRCTSATPPPPLPTWKDEIAKNFVPYHQLSAADFPINDKSHAESAFWIKTFVHYYYHYLAKPAAGGAVYAYATDWTVFSGLDKNDTSRHSSARNLKQELPYAQAVFDLDEIYARELAALKTGDLPVGNGDTFQAAIADLDQRVKAFCRERYAKVEVERDVLVKTSKRGANKKKVRELADAIRKRLDALPPVATPTPAPSNSPSATPGASPTPSVSANKP